MRKVRKKQNYNSFFKKLISALMAFIIPVTSSSCKTNNTYEEIDSTITYSDSQMEDFSFEKENSKYMNNPDFFANKKGYNEYNDEQLNETIDKIKQISYESSCSYFKEYNLDVAPSLEIQSIMKNYIYDDIDESLYKKEYNWYKSGVDKDLLYNKIYQNTKNSNIDLTENIKKAINVFCENLEGLINEVKSIYPDFNFQIPFLNIDELSFSECNDSIYYSYYDYASDEISVNFELNSTDEELLNNLMHEAVHLIMNSSYRNHGLLKTGCALDNLETFNSSLELRFLDEYTAEEISCNYLKNENVRYYDELQIINLLSLLTNSSKDEILKCYLSKDANNLINLFEPEFRDFNYVFSITYSLALSIGYGNYIGEYDEFDLKGDFQNYAVVNLIKNYYVKILKDLKTKKISEVQARNILQEMKEKLFDDEFIYIENKEELTEYINNFDNLIINIKKI